MAANQAALPVKHKLAVRHTCNVEIASSNLVTGSMNKNKAVAVTFVGVAAIGLLAGWVAGEPSGLTPHPGGTDELGREITRERPSSPIVVIPEQPRSTRPDRYLPKPPQPTGVRETPVITIGPTPIDKPTPKPSKDPTLPPPPSPLPIRTPTPSGTPPT
jgi:hypothetical protein